MNVTIFSVILSLFLTTFSFAEDGAFSAPLNDKPSFSWFSAAVPDEVAEEMYMEAKALAAEGTLDKAVRIFGMLASLSPAKCQSSHLEVARCHINRNDSKRAFQWLTAYNKKYGESDGSMFLLGNALALDEDFEKAASAYESSLKLNDKDPAVHLALALVYDRLSQFNKVIEHSQMAVQLDPAYRSRLKPIIHNSNMARDVGRIIDEVLRESEDGQLTDEQINDFARRVGDILEEEPPGPTQ
jgi:tetratricopeptide (TPR) repeat protein